MKNDIKPGGSYLIRVTVPEAGTSDEENMICVVTEDDGAVVYVHRDALIPGDKEDTDD